MPTTFVARAGFDRATGRWVDPSEQNIAFGSLSRTAAVVAVVVAAFLICALCLTSGAHPVEATTNAYSVLLGP